MSAYTAGLFFEKTELCAQGIANFVLQSSHPYASHLTQHSLTNVLPDKVFSSVMDEEDDDLHPADGEGSHRAEHGDDDVLREGISENVVRFRNEKRAFFGEDIRLRCCNIGRHVETTGRDEASEEHR